MTKKNLAYAVVIALIVVVADQASKQWALHALGDGQSIALLGDALSLHLTFNPGAAFSFLDDATWIFTLLSSIFVLGVPFLVPKFSSVPVLYTGALIWGGALGNLIDRLMRAPGFPQGHVVDFIRYSNWFIGNVADIALVVGFALLILLEIRGSTTFTKQEKK
ncbi:signal peptidase II [Arcanobacterium buesumense]|uniref:Lipoprotein signal peptidase n=1 Tax=Arcanobacterium buesumense TaxID=2722751 RepID=A0A6H2EKY3_9ACTO|nr:signal peptidase II [Arcanobacterium buesumense]QJC21619.1 signal peptidase II [Arcanobacterium buesumense]